MDPALRRRLSAGRKPIEAVLDLHGHRQAEAHSRLVSFITSAHRHGKRVVLVITGKGREEASDMNPGSGRGVLRRLVPLWLGDPRIASLIVAFTEAGRTHGGEGAMYVHLRNGTRRTPD
jgi:DNA-nicking Smr family endonuclease